MARLPARSMGPRRSATPAAEEPAEDDAPRPTRSVTRVHASAVGILLVLVLSVVAVVLLRSKPAEVPAGADGARRCDSAGRGQQRCGDA